jgi:hypothetical protein
MIPELGAEGAALLQRQMTEHIFSSVTRFAALQSIAVQVRYEGGSQKRMRGWLGAKFDYRPQGGGDIGIRMARALGEGFEDGCQAVVIIGSDIPGISSDILKSAFNSLANQDLVLGPAADGGYYLIGIRRSALNRATPRIFGGIQWGTDAVLSQTLAIARDLKLKYRLLDTLKDVDRPDDIGVWHRALEQRKRNGQISVIIPTLNEAGCIKETITHLQKSDRIEIVVVDGGSRDNTVPLVRSLGVKVLSSEASKAVQMNTGAAASNGDVFLFLHADTLLPDNFEAKVMAAVSQNGFGAGAFSLGIDSNVRGLRFIERIANWRSRVFQMPYGDQALFVCRNLFREIGGFPDFPIMEDFELVRRLRRKGKICILPDSVLTSPRRYLNIGILNAWILNQIIIAAYYLGVPPQRLALWYRREKGNSGN